MLEVDLVDLVVVHQRQGQHDRAGDALAGEGGRADGPQRWPVRPRAAAPADVEAQVEIERRRGLGAVTAARGRSSIGRHRPPAAELGGAGRRSLAPAARSGYSMRGWYIPIRIARKASLIRWTSRSVRSQSSSWPSATRPITSFSTSAVIASAE